MSIDDQRDLYERLDGAIETITPGPAPVDGVMRRGRVIKWRRRSVAVAGVAVVVAAGVIAVPSLRHTAIQGPATSRYTVTVQSPGPHSPAGLIASGTVNGQHWQFTTSRPGTDGAPRGQERIQVTGAAFGGAGPATTTPAFRSPGRGYPASITAMGEEPNQVQFGAVQSDVSYITVQLGNGAVLTLHPARVYGARVVAFALPLGAPVLAATAYSARGAIATAVPFNEPGGLATFGVWLNRGQHGLARASGRIGSGTYLGKSWSAAVYLGPWGVCVTGKAGEAAVSSCQDATSGSDLSTGPMFWTEGVPALTAGNAAPSVARIVATSPAGKITQVRLVTVGDIKFFAFPFSKGPKSWKWTAYDAAGHTVASGTVDPRA